MPGRVLIAEDEALVALDLGAQLRELGYTIVGSSASGEEIIKLARELSPDIVLMDLRLQGSVSGFQAAVEIQKQKEIAIVFVTASSDRKTLDQLNDMRTFGVLKKPFTNEQLRAVLQALNHREEGR